MSIIIANETKTGKASAKIILLAGPAFTDKESSLCKKLRQIAKRNKPMDSRFRGNDEMGYPPIIPVKAGMTGGHERVSPENSSNRVIILAPQGFDGDSLRFYETLGSTMR